MSKRHTVTLHHVFTVHNDMFDNIDGVMRAAAKKSTQWKEDLYFAVKVAQHKLSTSYPAVNKTTSQHRISAYILHSFQKWRSFRKCDKAMHINPKDETLYTVQYQEAFLKYTENEYWTKHRRMSVINPEHVPHRNVFCSALVSGVGYSCFVPYNFSGNDDENLSPKTMTESSSGRSNHAAE